MRGPHWAHLRETRQKPKLHSRKLVWGCCTGISVLGQSISVLAACLELAVGQLLTEDIRVVDIGFSSWHRLVSANLINSS